MRIFADLVYFLTDFALWPKMRSGQKDGFRAEGNGEGRFEGEDGRD